MANKSIDWEDPGVSIGDDITAASIAAAGYGTWTKYFGSGHSGTMDIQAPGWGGKALRLVTNNAVWTGMTGTTTFNFDSTSDDVTMVVRGGCQDRLTVIMHWDGLPAPAFPPNPKNGFSFENRVSTNGLKITRWSNGSFSTVNSKTKATVDKNDFELKCVIKSNGDIEFWLDGTLELTGNDTSIKSGGFGFYCFGALNTFADDIVITQGGIVLPLSSKMGIALGNGIGI